MLLWMLLGEGKVKRTYPESLCCSNSREPRSEDGELHDEYMYISCFVLFVGLSSDGLFSTQREE